MTDDSDTDPEPMQVPPDVYQQLEALRESGAVNMLTEIEHGLAEMDFDTALDWVQANKDAYIDHAMRGGFEPAVTEREVTLSFAELCRSTDAEAYEREGWGVGGVEWTSEGGLRLTFVDSDGTTPSDPTSLEP